MQIFVLHASLSETQVKKSKILYGSKLKKFLCRYLLSDNNRPYIILSPKLCPHDFPKLGYKNSPYTPKYNLAKRPFRVRMCFHVVHLDDSD